MKRITNIRRINISLKTYMLHISFANLLTCKKNRKKCITGFVQIINYYTRISRQPVNQ